MNTTTITDATVGATRVKVVEPGVGDTGGLMPGVGVQFKIDGPDTGGLVSIVERPFGVGALVPPDVHHLENEISYLLEGEIGFRSETTKWRCEPAATSSSRADRCAPCGMQDRNRLGCSK